MNAQAIIVILILAGVGFAIYWFAIRKKANEPVGATPPFVGSGWTFVYSKNIAGDPANFTFPQVDGVHYVCKAAQGIAMGKTITMTFSISGDGALLVADKTDTTPATVRLFLWGQTVNDRWWGDVKTNLTTGDHTVSILIDPAHWTGVGGTPTVVQAPFPTVISNPYAMGYTFGGQSFAGHGVYANGNVRFTLKSYVVA